ncbi:MAG: SDR family oxidoreductase [Candidatus Schekmanbacteria bacterium]|nr:SDR family oxidoreductase [Candidatus Schekmanbacteria bacterium]
MVSSYWNRKVAVITGASRGIGRAVALELGRRGGAACLAARSPAELNAVAAEIESLGSTALAVPTDVTCVEQVRALADAAARRFGRVDVLINNAGRTMRGRCYETTPAQFRELFELNFIGALHCVQAFLPLLRESKGAIVNVSSLAGKRGSPLMGAYPATKAALNVFTEQLRVELAELGVWAGVVCPGPVDTRLMDNAMVAGDLPPDALRPGASARLQMATPETVARALLRAVERRRPETILPRSLRYAFALGALAPRLADRVTKRLTQPTAATER